VRSVVGRWLPIAVAVVTAVLVLGGYFLASSDLLVAARETVLRWAVILSGFALVLGILNILRVHFLRLAFREPGWPYSLVLLLSALGAWVPGILPLDDAKDGLFEYVLGPLGAGFMALMLVTLVLAAVRILRTRQSIEAPVFLLIAGVVMLGSTPLAGSGLLAGFRDWLLRVPGMAGTRGLALGVALGALVTGLRVLLANERPYAEPPDRDGAGRQSPRRRSVEAGSGE
jgi:hypothetical protein